MADLFGDSREEMIVRSTDSSKVRVYMNTEVSEHKNYTLMQNQQYRVGIASQNSSYNQPAYTDYYYASDTNWAYVTVPGKTGLEYVDTSVAAQTLSAAAPMMMSADGAEAADNSSIQVSTDVEVEGYGAQSSHAVSV